jgi:hypothetical protein
MAERLHYLLAAGAALLLQGCTVSRTAVPTGGPLATTSLGSWPPTSIQCVRNDPVPFNWNGASIGGELTRLFADPLCVAQPVCFDWGAKENRPLTGPVSGQFWMGPSNSQFTKADQDSIGQLARSAALAQAPSNKSLIRLTFAQPIIVGGGSSTGVVQATANYGRCLLHGTDTAVPKKAQN